MSNQLKNKLATMQSGNSGAGMTTVKLIYLLFISTLSGIFSLSINAAEPANTTFKVDSGYYDGSFGRGAYWVTKGLYSSIFSVGVKDVIDTDAPNSNTNKLPDLNHEGADKPVKYFIYSHYHLGHTSDSSQIGHDVIQAEHALITQKLQLSRKVRE